MFHMAQFATASCSLPVHFLHIAAPELVRPPTNMTVEGEGGMVFLKCEGRSKPPPTIQWLKDGVPVNYSTLIDATRKYSLGTSSRSLGYVDYISLRSTLVVLRIETSDT